MIKESNTYYSNGKLLLTGEYVVLFGAKALAFPTKFGQNLSVNPGQKIKKLNWEAYELNRLWFSAEYSLPDFKIERTSSMDQAVFLRKILLNVQSQNNALFTEYSGYSIKTETDFPINWGLGTSSTLVNNLAQLAQVNPFELSFGISGGSGYDIACAGISSPIVYRKTAKGEPLYSEVRFAKSFEKNLYFIYSGKKKNTQNHVSDFIRRHKGFKSEIKSINQITDRILNTDDFDIFKEQLEQHEEIISQILKIKRVQKDRFFRFGGVIKSLGAWGGDFLLAGSDKGAEYVRNYFEQFGLSTIIPFKEMILS